VDESTLLFLDYFPEINIDGEGSQYVPATSNKLTIRPDDPPWVFPPTLSPPGSIKAVESSVVATQSARNVGQRRGPLDAKTREGANKLRKIRACANCRIQKLRVS
jgi:hypothetical protein